jgi:integrase
LRRRRIDTSPITVPPLKAYAQRARGIVDGQAYWVIGRHVRGQLVVVPGASGWASRDGAMRLMLQLVDSGLLDRPAGAPRTVQALLDDWVEAQARRIGSGLSEGGWRAYRSVARHFRRHSSASDLHVDVLDEGGFEELVEELGRSLAPRTVQTCVKRLRTAWSWGRRRKLVAGELPQVRLATPTGYRNNHATPSEDDALAVLERMTGAARIAFLVALYTGARRSEVAFRTEDVDLVRRTATFIRKGRDGQPQVVELGLHPDLVDELAVWREDCSCPIWFLGVDRPAGGRLLYRGIQAALAAIADDCNAADVPAFTPHGLRRLASTKLFEANVPPQVYELLMGHGYRMGRSTYAVARTDATRRAIDVLSPGHATQQVLTFPGAKQ